MMLLPARACARAAALLCLAAVCRMAFHVASVVVPVAGEESALSILAGGAPNAGQDEDGCERKFLHRFQV